MSKTTIRCTAKSHAPRRITQYRAITLHSNYFRTNGVPTEYLCSRRRAAPRLLHFNSHTFLRSRPQRHQSAKQMKSHRQVDFLLLAAFSGSTKKSCRSGIVLKPHRTRFSHDKKQHMSIICVNSKSKLGPARKLMPTRSQKKCSNICSNGWGSASNLVLKKCHF